MVNVINKIQYVSLVGFPAAIEKVISVILADSLLDKPDNGVIGGRKGHKFGLKFRIEKTKAATHIWR